MKRISVYIYRYIHPQKHSAYCISTVTGFAEPPLIRYRLLSKKRMTAASPAHDPGPPQQPTGKQQMLTTPGGGEEKEVRSSEETVQPGGHREDGLAMRSGYAGGRTIAL